MTLRNRLFDRGMQWWGHHGGIAQFHRPTGWPGHVAGWVMAHRSSNVARNRWAVQLLQIRPADRVIEFGCGPGVAVAALAELATQGEVVGVDHSAVVLRQARRRNRAAVRRGRVRLIAAPVEELATAATPFDAALAVNTVGMWPDPPARLRQIAGLLRPGGRIAVVSQPRCTGASAATTATAADELTRQLTAAGFVNLRSELLDLDPPVVCVLAATPSDPRR